MLEQFAKENNNKMVTDFLRFSEDSQSRPPEKAPGHTYILLDGQTAEKFLGIADKFLAVRGEISVTPIRSAA